MCQFSGGGTSKLALDVDSFWQWVVDILGHSFWPVWIDAIFYTLSEFVKRNLFAGGQEDIQQCAGIRGYERKINFKRINWLDIRTYGIRGFVCVSTNKL